VCYALASVIKLSSDFGGSDGRRFSRDKAGVTEGESGSDKQTVIPTKLITSWVLTTKLWPFIPGVGGSWRNGVITKNRGRDNSGVTGYRR
jgi:hypothetical protein